MARIPDDELERLKREVDLVELARSAGVELKGTGDTLLGLCPFHDDRNPSLVITPSKNLWSCKGACSAGGSVVDWVMRSEEVGFRHAVEILRDKLGMSPVESGFRVGSSSLPSPVTFDAPDHVVLDQVVDYYHAVLLSTPDAQAYLKRRGIWDPDAVRAFKLGFVDRTLGLRLPRRNTASGTQVRDQLQRLGICRASGHEHLRGCLVIPVYDERGRVSEIYGRRVDAVKGGGSPHLYLPGPHKGLWNLAALRDTREVILCESLIDALTFWCAGFRNVTASYGTNGFTSDHLEAFKAYGVERVLVAYDRDDAGDQAAKKLGESLAAEEISTYRVLFPRGMDTNAYALKVKPVAQSLAVLLRAAEHMAGPLVTRSLKNRPTEDLAGEPEASPPFAASPEPAPPRIDIPAEVSDTEVVVRLGERRWRVRGLEKNLSFEQLRVNLLVATVGADAFHVDTFDLYSARQRTLFLKLAATELGLKQDVLKADLGKVLLKLEQLQEQRITKALEPKEEKPLMTEAERAEAIALLQDPCLMERVAGAFDACGLVGEHTNRQVAYLAAVSRRLERPLAVMVQSSSAAGKSALMDAVLALVPSEERVHYSAMTGQSLFYMGEADLQHKVLAIAEEEGAERASYALKLLQSEGELTIASTGKDPASGRLTTHEYRVEGPVAILMTTTAVDLDEELLNRCIVLTVDEGRDQTRAIHDRQREEETLEGWRSRRRRDHVVKLHQNAQRLLKPLRVVNPFAHALHFPDSSTRTRRDHQKYLSIIRSIALLHQHQRTIRHDRVGEELLPYVEVTLSDVELANRLAAEVLGRTLDELPPQSRRLLELVHAWVGEQCEQRKVKQSGFRFTRRQVREAVGWGNTQLKVHLHRLEEMEYLLAHRGGPGQLFVYELLYEGQGAGGAPFVLGLVDADRLRDGSGDRIWSGPETDRPGSEINRSVSREERSAPSRPEVGGVSGGGRGEPTDSPKELYQGSEEKAPRNAHQGPSKDSGSYVRQSGERQRRVGAA